MLQSTQNILTFNRLLLISRLQICPVRVSTMPNKTLPDLETLREARKFIHKHRKDSDPFFLAVGFQKPHIPLKYPEHYLSTISASIDICIQDVPELTDTECTMWLSEP